MKHSPSVRSPRFLPLAVALLIVLWASPAQALVFDWVVGIAPFESLDSWSPNDFPSPPYGPPGSADVARFAQPGGPRAIVFSSSPTNQQAVVQDGSYVFFLNGWTYSLTSTPSVLVGVAAGLSPSLTLAGGTLAGVEGRVATVAGGSGTVTLGDAAVAVPATWANTGNLYVGDAGTGVLNVLNGSSVQNAAGYLGYAGTGTGTATVDGAGSTWTNSTILRVGSDGTGTLKVTNGGKVSNTAGYLGMSSTGIGTATVDGPGSTWTNSGFLRVGQLGTGTLNVLNGGDVSSTTGFVGNRSTANGTATVDGAGSTWTNYSDLYVGYEGTGRLNVLNGGSVSNANGYLGYNSSGVGTATVDGAGSTWSSSGSLYVGGSAAAAGGTGLLTVQNGGLVNAGSLLKVWNSGTVNVTGGQLVAGGPRPGVDASLTIGSYAVASLSIVGGGDVSNTTGYLGYAVGGNGTATVDGVGSTWANSGELCVGWSGTGTLNITNGGSVSNTSFGYLGSRRAGIGTATVDGAGSTWTNGHALMVGYGGTGTLNVLNGGSVSNIMVILGYEFSGNGTATVDGAGSTWACSGWLRVGTGTLNVLNGGSVSNTNGYLGYYSESDGDGTATVDGAGSTWSSSGSLYVGGSDNAAGGTGLLTVQNGGLVNAGSLLKVWNSGTVNVTGGQLVAGGPGPGVDGSLTIGSDASASLSIVGGGDVSNTTGYLGYAVGGNGTATVTGAGSTWTNSVELYVGHRGTGTLSVQNGGRVESAWGDLGYSSSGVGTATVDGAGSTWTNSGGLYVGRYGAGTLNVLNGGSVSNTRGYLGYFSSGVGTATVDGAGSTWTNSSFLYVGDFGTGTLSVLNGGTVSNTSGYLGSYSSGNGTATVDGPGSLWTNSDALYLGGDGAGTLNVLNGGSVSNTVGYLGLYSTGQGTATVDGAGSLWTNSGSLYVGGPAFGAAGLGNLTVSNRGEVRVADTLKVWRTGTVNLDPGGLVAADVVQVVPGATLAQAAGSTLRVNALSGFGDAPSFAGSLHLGHAAGVTGSGAYSMGSAQSLSVGEDLVVGYDAPGTLTVQNGGSVSDANGWLAYVDGSTGTATVDGAGSVWANSVSVSVGYGATGMLSVQNGGRVESAWGDLGYSSSGVGTATVDGAGSTWTNSGGLYVGRYGAGTLNVLNGGSVSNTRGYLGYETTGTGTATVDGAGSTWTNTAALYVGGSATAAGGTGLLTVQNDGLVHAGTLLKVWDAGTVNVTGGQLVAGGPAPGIDGSLTIGRDAAAQLSIVGGGDVLNTNGYLGYSGGGNGTATVTGAGSTWTNSGDLYVGRIGWGTLSVQNGGRVESGGGYLGDAGIGVGTATVDGVGSTWANSSSLLVGFFGWGTLNVQNGGSVSSGNGWLAYADGSNGTATVTGAGSTWTNTAALYVGGSADAAGGTGLLTVQNGGEVRVGDTLKVWGAGTVNLNAGGLVVADVAEVVPGSTFNTQAGSTLRVNALSGFGDHPSFAGALQFGHAGGGGSGGYTLGAGQSLQTGEGLTVGYDATGVFTQTGGANTVGGDLVLASEAGSTGTYHYQGGTLSLGGAIRGGAGTSAFIVGGGSGFPMLSYDGSLSLVNLSIFGIENQGTVEVLGGATLSPGQLTVAAGGLLAIDRATVALTTALNNDGEVLLGNAVSARIQAPVVNNSGLLGGQGRVLADVANTGELFVGAAERLTITGGVDNDGGLLTVAGGTMTVQGDLDNYNAAQVALGGTLRLNGSLTNRDGGMVVGNGWLQADAGLANSSTMAFSGVTNVRGDVDNTGLIIVSGVGPTTFFDDLTNNGEIRVSGGTSAVYFGCVDGAGIFTGTGTNYFEGDLCPGTSPGILSFEGDVVFAATNHLIMELAGFDADTGYDQVNILGNLTLGGELELIVDRAFRDLIQPDDTFILMTAGTLSGEFSNVAPGATLQSADLLSEFTVYYGPASPYGAEFVVLGNAAAIPEPATLTLLALGGLGLLRRRRRRWR